MSLCNKSRRWLPTTTYACIYNIYLFILRIVVVVVVVHPLWTGISIYIRECMFILQHLLYSICLIAHGSDENHKPENCQQHVEVWICLGLDMSNDEGICLWRGELHIPNQQQEQRHRTKKNKRHSKWDCMNVLRLKHKEMFLLKVFCGKVKKQICRLFVCFVFGGKILTVFLFTDFTKHKSATELLQW